MKYLARTADGRPLVGSGSGFVPLGAVHSELETVRDAVPRAAAETLGDPAATSADPVMVRL